MLREELQSTKEANPCIAGPSGYNAKNCVSRCLQLVFTNENAQAFSWTGQKNNIPLKELKLIHVIRCKYLEYEIN